MRHIALSVCFLFLRSSFADVLPISGTPLLLDIPVIQQTTPYSCGAAAMASVMAYYGQTFDEETLMRELGTDPKHGTEETKMAEWASQHGVPARIAKNQTLADLAAAIEKRHAVIPLIQAWVRGRQKPWPEVWDAGHYVVLIGLDAQNVFFVDPSIPGRRGYIPAKEFQERWHDTDLKNGKLHQVAIYFEAAPKPWHPWAKID